jgi:hypothetical protein
MVKKLFILGDINKKLLLPFLLAISQIFYNVHTSKFPEKMPNQIFETYSLSIPKFFILIIPHIFKADTTEEKSLFLRRKKVLNYSLLFLIYGLNIGFIYGAALFNKDYDAGKQDAKNPSTVGEFLKQGIEMIFLALISIFLLKYKYFIHNYIAIGSFILFGLINDIILDLYSKSLKVGAVSLIMSFIALITDAIYLCYQKYMMEKLFYPYWDIVLVPGIILFVLNTTVLIFILFAGKDSSISLVSGFYKYFENVEPEIIIGKFLINIIFNFFLSTFTILTLFNFTPDYVLISVSLSKFVNFLIDYQSDRYYFIIFFILQFFCLLLYLEIIELNFCKLNKNTRRNIKIRGDEDLSGKNESDSQRESLVEVSPGYLLDNGNKGDIIEMRNQSVDQSTNKSII